ncbi:hypothetical protein Acsp01_90960 [Actinoplanes sp. NBRC 101535]|nr:hypothetical protein Acsp01_90960 [Actinoplanes sp. NBRC 101535]
MPCSGLLITPDTSDTTYWPLRIPRGYRHCDVPWNERVRTCVRKAEDNRRRWQTGLNRETDRVRALAAAHDPRYRAMTPAQLDHTALWRWRLTGAAQALRHSEREARDQADRFVSLVRFRHHPNG